MSKQVTLMIAGEELAADFGVNWFYKHYYDISGVDFLVNGINGVGTVQTFDICTNIFFAGHKAWASFNKEPEVWTKDRISDYVLGLDATQAGALLTKFTDAIKPKEVETGELQAQVAAP